MIIRLFIQLTITILAFLIGGLFFVSLSFPKISKNDIFLEPIYLAHKIQNSHGGNCVEFRNFWHSIYPTSKIIKMRLIRGVNHYAIVLLETEKSLLLIDSNNDFSERISIWRIDKNDKRIIK